MSLATWRREFYRTPASKVSTNKALEHSLRKWIGLLPKNRKKHDVKLSFSPYPHNPILMLSDAQYNELDIDSSSCALCVHYNNTDVDCGDCPLGLIKNSKTPCCDEYEDARDNNKVAPMIRLLQKAQKKGLVE